jgi:plasmid stabilization system protein ParE
MIAARAGSPRLPRVKWRRTARRSLDSVVNFLRLKTFADPEAFRQLIEDAVESLRYAPLRCAVEGRKGRLRIRRLVVDRRYFVYYVYAPPRGMTSGGTLSIRLVKHAASRNPFLEVREGLACDQPLGVLSTHDRAEFTVAATA